MDNVNELIDTILKIYNFEDYPIEYKEVLIQITDEARKIFKDNLLSLTLGGSGGKNKIHVNWSDLDIYFILKKYNINQVIRFMSIKWKYSIHVGTTYYTIDEIKNNILDNKTKIMVYEKNTFNVNPTIIGEELFPLISYDEIKLNDFNNLANTLHQVRRDYIEIKNKKKKLQKKNVKKLLLLMKCILNYYNIFIYGYEAVFTAFYNLISGLTKQNDDAIIRIIDNIDVSSPIYLDVCEDVFNFLERNLNKDGKKS